jgi:serine/threonine protein kinase
MTLEQPIGAPARSNFDRLCQLIEPPIQQMMVSPPGTTLMPEKDPLNISGQVVAEKYRIQRLVGEGGFAVVYRAEHTIWKQPVAVKFFSGLSQAPPELREELLQQFIQEGALLTELSSHTAGIVQARDVGAYTTAAGQWMPFMVLEWLDGSPLEAVLAQDQALGYPWTENEVVGFLRRILPILDVAHRRGITHRDIKPANIFITGSAARAPETPCKLLDFGVAKMVSDQAKVNAALAKTGVAITSFTPRYGAPEQFTRSYGATGPWTDVYSVALVACEMLTCRVALQGDDLVQFGFSSANPAQRPTPRFLGAPVSDRLEAVFAKALAVRPADRFQNAGEFLAAAAPGTQVSIDPAVPHASASPSLQLAPTVLVRTERQPVSPATKKPELPPPKEDKSGLGSLIFILLVLAGGVVGYSTTDFRGARELRGFFSSLVRVVRKEAVQQLPKLREKTRQAVDNAVGMLAGTGGQAGQAPECPPGTRRVTSLPVHGQDVFAGSGENGLTGVVCVDEHLVSEIDYAACATCERSKLGRTRAKRKTRGHSQFCMSGKAPTADPIRCVSWKQADAYCQARAARLPTDDELRAVAPAATGAPMEWTGTMPGAGRPKLGPFRCVRGP